VYFAVTLQLMKWQPAVENVCNSDGIYENVTLFDAVRQLDATGRNVANVKCDQLIKHESSFVDEVLIIMLVLVFVLLFLKGKSLSLVLIGVKNVFELQGLHVIVQ